MTDENKGRLINGALLVGGLAVLFESALPRGVTLSVLGILGVAVAVLVVPSWVAQKWSLLKDGGRSR